MLHVLQFQLLAHEEGSAAFVIAPDVNFRVHLVDVSRNLNPSSLPNSAVDALGSCRVVFNRDVIVSLLFSKEECASATEEVALDSNSRVAKLDVSRQFSDAPGAVDAFFLVFHQLVLFSLVAVSFGAGLEVSGAFGPGASDQLHFVVISQVIPNVFRAYLPLAHGALFRRVLRVFVKFRHVFVPG